MPPNQPSTARARAIALVQIALAAAILMWPLLVAGRPTLFADTGAYWRQGRTVIVQGLGLDRAAPDPFDLTLGGQVVDQKVVRDPAIASSFSAARSPVYGVFLYVTQRLGTLWLTAALQALATAAVIHAAWRLAAPKAAWWTYLALMAGLAAATSLPFYASFAMPDAFAGLDILAVAALALYWDRMGRRTRIAFWSLLAVSLSFHASHLMVAAAMLPVALFGLWRLGAGRRAMLDPLRRPGCGDRHRSHSRRCGRRRRARPDRRPGPQSAVPDRAAAGRRAGTRLSAPRLRQGRAVRAVPVQGPAARQFGRDPVVERCRQGGLHDLAAAESGWRWRPNSRGSYARWSWPIRSAWPAPPCAISAQQLGRFYVDDPLHDPCQMTRALVLAPEHGPGVGGRRRALRRRRGLILPPAPLYGLHGAALVLAGFAIWWLARRRRARCRRPRRPR